MQNLLFKGGMWNIWALFLYRLLLFVFWLCPVETFRTNIKVTKTQATFTEGKWTLQQSCIYINQSQETERQDQSEQSVWLVSYSMSWTLYSESTKIQLVLTLITRRKLVIRVSHINIHPESSYQIQDYHKVPTLMFHRNPLWFLSPGAFFDFQCAAYIWCLIARRRIKELNYWQ